MRKYKSLEFICYNDSADMSVIERSVSAVMKPDTFSVVVCTGVTADVTLCKRILLMLGIHNIRHEEG